MLIKMVMMMLMMMMMMMRRRRSLKRKTRHLTLKLNGNAFPSSVHLFQKAAE